MAEAGHTLAELMVTLGLMSLVMALITAGTLAMYGLLNRSEAISDASEKLRIVVDRLQKEVAYASSVGVEQITALDAVPDGQGVRPGDWYVDYLRKTYDGSSQCVELRLLGESKQLQRRTWPSADTPDGTWSVLADNVFPSADSMPFELTDAGTEGSNFARLAINLSVSDGVAERPINVSVVALNTSLETNGSSVCRAGRRAA